MIYPRAARSGHWFATCPSLAYQWNFTETGDIDKSSSIVWKILGTFFGASGEPSNLCALKFCPPLSEGSHWNFAPPLFALKCLLLPLFEPPPAVNNDSKLINLCMAEYFSHTQMLTEKLSQFRVCTIIQKKMKGQCKDMVLLSGKFSWCTTSLHLSQKVRKITAFCCKMSFSRAVVKTRDLVQ